MSALSGKEADNGHNHNGLREKTGGNMNERKEEKTAGLSQMFGTANEVMNKYNHCALCGANLHFTHVTDFSRNLTQETARCPECGTKSRQIMHRLQ
jgi:DNA-directed RNA polymerase subunit RPC12/RpoP